MRPNLIKQKFLYFLKHQVFGVHAGKRRKFTISRIRNKKFEKESILRWEDDGGQVYRQDIVSIRSDRLNTLTDKSEWKAYKDEYLVNDSLGG